MRAEIISRYVNTPGEARFYRVLHDWEIAKRQFIDPRHGQFYHPEEGWAWRDSFPEVFWLIDSHRVPFDERWQRLSYAMNPEINPKKWRIVHADYIAFLNRTGFWEPASPYLNRHVQDFINNIDVSPNNPLPEWDKVRACGGMTLRGVPDGNGDVIVETLKYDQVPTWEELEPMWWLYFRAVTVHKKPDGTCAIRDFPQGDGRPVNIPLVAIDEVRFPLGALEEVGERADPYRIYIGG